MTGSRRLDTTDPETAGLAHARSASASPNTPLFEPGDGRAASRSFYPPDDSKRPPGPGSEAAAGEDRGRSSSVVDNAKRPSRGDLLNAGAEGWGFYCSVFAGILVGWGLDTWWGTRPVFLALGLLAGAGLAFWKLWIYLKGGEV